MMKAKIVLMLLAILVIGTQVEATVMTYDGWAGNNYDIKDYYDAGTENYGSRISSSPVAYHEDLYGSDISAVFTVGNGWTPNIEADWNNGTGWWDSYSGWAGNEVAQIQGSSLTSPRDLVLTPDAGYGVLVNSFILDEWAGGGAISVDWAVFDDTGTLASGTWLGDDLGLRETVSTGLTAGDMTVGNAVTLRFEQTAGTDTYLAMDDLNFDQFVPEPTTLSLLGLGGLSLIRRKRS